MTKKIDYQRWRVGPLQTNCYFLSCERQTIIIDPGDEGDFLSEEVLRQKLQPRLIFLTHAHFDHICGVWSLVLNFKLPVFLAPADLKLYRVARPGAKFYAHYQPGPILPARQLLTDIEVATTLIHQVFPQAQLLPFPGHSPGQTALFLPETSADEPWLFSGDFIFAGSSLGRTDFLYSQPEQMRASLQRAQDLLPPTTHVFPGHEADFKLRDFDFSAPSFPSRKHIFGRV